MPSARSLSFVVGVVVCFFVSGLTSLALETAWSKYLTYLLGTDLYGTTTTVVAYMGGLGFGALLAARVAQRLRSPLKVYALLQVGIGLAGLASIPLFRATQPLFAAVYAFSDNRHWFLLFRFLITFGLMLPATTLMGLTLPVVIRAVSDARRASPATAGVLYGVNTLGAVVGALLAGLWVIPSYGLLRTCLAAGFLDLAIAALALGLQWLLPARSDAEATVQPDSLVWTRRGAELPVAYFVAGAVALGLELCWFRLLGQIIGPTAHAFAITLAVFLGGLAIGSLAGSRLPARIPSATTLFSALLMLSAVLAVVPLYYLDQLPGWYYALWSSGDKVGTELALVGTQAFSACALMLPATLTMGALFPAAVHAFRIAAKGHRDVATLSAVLFFSNTLGAVVGTLFWGFVLVPAVGATDAMRLAASCSVAAAVLVMWRRRQRRAVGARNRGLALALSGTVAALLVVYRTPSPDAFAMNIGTYKSVHQKRGKGAHAPQLSKRAEILFVRDGLNGSVAVVKNRLGAGELDLAYSGKWVASTVQSSRPHLHLLAHLPALVAPNEPKRALVIGFGSGITTGSLLTYPSLKRVDIVEIEPAVIEAATYFEAYNHAPLADPRTNLILQDGRTYVAFSDAQYDLITSDPIHPWVKGAANLYTLEYYQRAAEILAKDGVFAQWIPSTMSVASFKTILRTMKAAFPHVSLFSSGLEMIAIGARQPIEVELSVIEARTRFDRVAQDLKENRLGTAQELYREFSSALRPVAIRGSGRLNTDDNVYLEHQLPWDLFRDARVRLNTRGKSKR